MLSILADRKTPKCLRPTQGHWYLYRKTPIYTTNIDKLRAGDFENLIVLKYIESIKIARLISPPHDTNFPHWHIVRIWTYSIYIEAKLYGIDIKVYKPCNTSKASYSSTLICSIADLPLSKGIVKLESLILSK
jgi:hypothetical protein